MKKIAKARIRLRARQAEYDKMLATADAHERTVLEQSYHRAGSLKCK